MKSVLRKRSIAQKRSAQFHTGRKEEDRIPLKTWQSATGLPIHIWHAFYDIAFGISLNDAEELIGQTLILPTQQVFQFPSGATARKVIYKIYYCYAYPRGDQSRAACVRKVAASRSRA